MTAFQIWQRDTCQAGTENSGDKVWRSFPKKGTVSLVASFQKSLERDHRLNAPWKPMSTSGNYILTLPQEFKTLTNTFILDSHDHN